jgi:uncharacterized protein YecE (DUF72 family)
MNSSSMLVSAPAADTDNGQPAMWIGTSGYVYPHWRHGVFYPEGLSSRDELAWYAARFPTVELNNPFYRLPAPATVERWRDAVPAGFQFAVKASRTITHLRRLREVRPLLDQFLQRAELLGPKLGPILFQLPPTLRHDQPLLEEFVRELAPNLHWVVEFRHPSWQVPTVYDLLGRSGIALCIPVGGRVQPDLVTTAPFVYFRMHAGAAPGGGFTDDQLLEWAGRIRALRRAGKETYVYFNNDWEGHAVRDAERLALMLKSLGRSG